MSASDTVLWAIERDPELRSTVTAVALLDRAPDSERLRRRVKAAVEAFPRLRQRVSESPLGFGHPRWVDDQFMDPSYHLRTVAAADPAIRWLLDFAASLAAAGFDRSRPLWELVVVEGLEDGRAAVIQKVHHSLTDGVGGMALMLSILDWARRPRREPVVEPVEGPPPGPLWTQAAQRTASVAQTASGAGRAAMRSAVNPIEAIGASWQAGRSVVRVVAAGGARLSPVLVGHGTSWRFEIYDQPMTTLRRAARSAGGTINDVFIAALAGGLHRYHAEHGQDVDALRLNLPVSIRRQGDPLGGNRFTPIRFVLPIAQPDPQQRVREIGALCRRWRKEPALPLTDAIAGVLSALPACATTAVMGSLLRGVDFVATNVPGIPKPCYIAGASVLREYAFAPLAGAAINIALVSHAGTACVGINLDRVAVPDPDLLMACLNDGFVEVSSLGRRRRTAVSASGHHRQ